MYTPMAPGNYLIGVKYGGPNHIVGSPFKAKVTGNHQTPFGGGGRVGLHLQHMEVPRLGIELEL